MIAGLVTTLSVEVQQRPLKVVSLRVRTRSCGVLAHWDVRTSRNGNLERQWLALREGPVVVWPFSPSGDVFR